MDAITLLREDHRRVESMLKKIDKQDLDVVPEVCQALTLHAILEEEIFYPAVRAEVAETDSTILESLEEHGVAKRLVAELEQMSPDDERYAAKATVLSEMVRHHVKEEEEELFRDVRDAMGRKALQSLGEKMRTRQEQLSNGR